MHTGQSWEKRTLCIPAHTLAFSLRVARCVRVFLSFPTQTYVLPARESMFASLGGLARGTLLYFHHRQNFDTIDY